jgi:hypothetical protein
MPFIAAGLQRPTPAGLPPPSEIAANSKNCAEALASQYDQSKVTACGLARVPLARKWRCEAGCALRRLWGKLHLSPGKAPLADAEP